MNLYINLRLDLKWVEKIKREIWIQIYKICQGLLVQILFKYTNLKLDY